MEKIIVIVGPTAVGKTKLSIELAKKINGEIISGDSMQVYKKLDIGTAKVTQNETRGIKHYLIDTKQIDENFTVAQWIDEAKKAIKIIINKGKVPIIVGGTGFYIAALLGDLPLGENKASADENIRKKWNEFAIENGNQELWNELNKIDPGAARNIEVNNVRRVVRALEVFELTGKPFSKQTRSVGKRKYDAFIIGLTTNRDVLYDRINQRVDIMIESGLEKEAKFLYDLGGEFLQSGSGIGYKEWFDYFNNKNDKKTNDFVVELIKRNSRRFAKRQLTWFKHQITGINWYDLVQNEDDMQLILEKCEEFIKK